MAKKPTITSITSGYASTNTLNDNFEALRDAFDNTLSLDGSTPNSMTSDLNLNNNDILNASRILVGGVDYIATALSYKNDAETAKTAAEAAQAAAELAYDNFDDRYLGSKASDPTVDNDGNALLDGALYYDTINTVMKFYDTSTSTWYRTTPTTSDQANIDIVAGNTTNINTVAGISANVTTVAGISSDVTTVAADGTDIGTVATSISNVNTAATNISNINTVAGISANVTTVAGNTTNINTVAGNNSNITTVAGISSDVTTVAGQTTNLQNVTDNLTAIQNAATNATNAANSASAAATSAAAAAASADFFDDVYLGSKASDPATDNDGDALNAGDLYFNTTSNNLKVYSGSAWQDAAVDSSSFVQKGGDTLTGNLSFDTNKALFGSRSNLEIYHSSTPVTASNLTIYFTNGSTSGTMVITDSDHSISVSDTVRVDSPEILNWSVLDIVGVDKSALQQDLTVSAVTSTTFTVPVTYASDPGTTGTLSQAGTYYYYTGSASSYISDQGAGSLNILGSEINIFNDAETAQLAQFNTTATKLFHNNSEKLATTSTGIDVTGTVTADGLTVQGVSTIEGKSSGFGPNAVFETTGTAKLRLDDLSSTAQNRTFITNNYSRSVSGFTADNSSFGVVNIGLQDGFISFDTAASGNSYPSERMRIDSSGRVGIGTTSPSTTLDVAGTVTVLSGSNGRINIGASNNYLYGDSSNNFIIGTAGSDKFQITSSGNVGIGTSSPSSKLHLQGSTGGYLELKMEPSADTDVTSIAFRNAADNVTKGYVLYDHTSNYMGFRTNGSGEAMRIDSSGNVGIGTSSPAVLSHVAAGYTAPTGGLDAGIRSLISSTGYTGLGILSASNASAYVHFGDPDDSDVGGIIYSHSSNHMQFNVNATERMRIDSSGNLLVGKTSVGYTVAGGQIEANGVIGATVTSNQPMFVNRLSTDGSLFGFYKDGTTVGSIGYVGQLVIHNSNMGIGFSNDDIRPVNGSGANTDNSYDLGHSSVRWKDLYLSGGVYLGGTGASNHLDDYEEGTFTPVIVGQTTGGTGTYTIQRGGYVKVGQFVTFQIQLGWTAHTGTGNFRISGLPFTSGSVTSVAYGGAFVAYNNGLSYTSGSTLGAYVAGGSNIIPLVQTTSGGVVSGVPMDSYAPELILVGSYIAA